MAYPVFASGDVLNASDMNAVGLWLVKSQTVGSGVSSVTVTGAFSSTYDNYKIILAGGVMDATRDISLQLGSTVTGYYGCLNYGVYNANTPLSIGWNNQTKHVYAGSGDSTYAAVDMDVLSPNLARPTLMNGAFQGTLSMGYCIGKETSTTQHTAFTFTFSGTMTGGTISVYGYRK